MYAYWISVNYREAYGIFACNGILFNHESPLRGETFVSRKITRAVSKIALGLQEKLYIGNLDAKRDWGHARDYVKVMWMILQADQPEDWVIATGKTTSVRDFIRMAFAHIGVELEFKGKGVNEIGVVKSSTHSEYRLKESAEIIYVDPNYFRPSEVDLLVGDPSKAKHKLGWTAETSLESLVNEMMNSDIELFKKEILYNK